MKSKYKCCICQRYVKTVPVKEPRVPDEVGFVCKKCGALRGDEVERERK